MYKFMSPREKVVSTVYEAGHTEKNLNEMLNTRLTLRSIMEKFMKLMNLKSKVAIVERVILLKTA